MYGGFSYVNHGDLIGKVSSLRVWLARVRSPVMMNSVPPMYKTRICAVDIDVLALVADNPLGPLFDVVSLNAILNAGGRADEVRCYPGTREEIIGKVDRWMDGWMFWLSGPAGAGKSAIAQTVAERGAKRGVHASNFFFFRSDNSRNIAQPLVATLIYQLIKFYPSLRDHLSEALTAQPLAYKAAVEEQFAHLLGSSMKNIRQCSAINQQIVLIIDGLVNATTKKRSFRFSAHSTRLSAGTTPHSVSL